MKVLHLFPANSSERDGKEKKRNKPLKRYLITVKSRYTENEKQIELQAENDADLERLIWKYYRFFELIKKQKL